METLKVTEIDEVKELVEQLRSETKRLQAATNLGRVAIRTRGAAMTRGSLGQAAESRARGVDFSPVFAALKDQRSDVRKEVAFALGELADETAVNVLEKLAAGIQMDENHEVRRAIADALGKIGGPKAVSVLQRLALEDPEENVRARAVGLLGNLAAKAQPELMATRGPVVRTRGAVKTRTATVAPRAETERILSLLKNIRESDRSRKVQDMADETLADLGE